MSDALQQPSAIPEAPVPVSVAVIAIIAVRCLSLLMLVDALGYQEITNFIHRSVRAWDSCLIFIASLLIFFAELYCARLLLRGSRRARWIWLLLQVTLLTYMLLASMGWIYPEIYSINGVSDAEIIRRTLMQRLPDLIILLLLFLPASSRAFFCAR